MLSAISRLTPEEPLGVAGGAGGESAAGWAGGCCCCGGCACIRWEKFIVDWV